MELGGSDIIAIIYIMINALIVAFVSIRKLLITIFAATVMQFIYCITAVDDVTDFDVEFADYHQWRMEYFVPRLSKFSTHILHFLSNCEDVCMWVMFLLQLLILGWVLFVFARLMVKRVKARVSTEV